jgi:hypothetical protein
MDAAKNFAKATVSQGYDDTATSIVLVAGGGARFPTVSFNAVWWNATDFPDPADDPNREIVRVTAISTDTLTITRAQEGTSAITHDTEGKVYKLMAGLTAKLVTDNLLNASRDGVNWQISSDGQLALTCTQGDALSLISGIMTAQVADGTAGIGDLDANNSGVAVRTDDALGQVSLTGQIGTDQSASATVGVGTISAKLPIYNLAGTLIGYIPIYASIT